MNEIHLQLEAFRINRDIPKFSHYFSANSERLNGLLSCIFELHPYPYKEYSSWLLVHMLREKKLDGTPYYNQLVDTLFNTENQTVLRNVANCLNEIELQEYRESEFIDRLIAFLNNASNKVALHMLAIHLLIKFCAKYPELISEVRQVIHLNAAGKSAAYKVAIRNFEKKFPE